MTSNGHTHQETHDAKALNIAFIAGIALNTAYVVIEAVFGLIYHSMGLLSDAGHNLSDIAALIISLVAFRLMSHKPDERHTYGYKKFTIQASFINALLLCIAVGAIIMESIQKLIHPVAVDGDAIAWVAAAGVIVNGVTTWLFMRNKGHDINIKSATLHMAADTMVSIGVVAGGIIIHFTDWYIIDPIIGFVIALIIAWSMRKLLIESIRMSIDIVPDTVDMPGLEKALVNVDGVESIHHLHVWPLSTVENAMTVHAVINDTSRLDQIITQIKQEAKKFGVSHSTVEAETIASPCRVSSLFDND